MRGHLRIGLLVGVAVGLVLGLFPLVPVVERQEIVQTEARRVDHRHLADFAAGEATGSLALLGSEGSPRLTLSGSGPGTYTSPPIPLGIPASALGAHWTQSGPSDAAVSLELRASEDGVAWDAWRTVEDEGGSAAKDRWTRFGVLLGAEDARYAQYRVSLTIGGVLPPVVHGVTLFALDSASAPARPEARLQLVPRDRGEATAKPREIVSRKQWGADERLGLEAKPGQPSSKVWPEELARVEKIVVHHTAGPNVCASRAEYCQRRSVVAINDVHYYHAVVNGWGDIGYNSLIGYDGRIYEGRSSPGGIDEPIGEPVVAGHALGYNRRTHGVAVMGDFDREPVPEVQYEALARLVGWVVESRLAAGEKIDPLGFSDYRLSDGKAHPALPNIVGHRDLNRTECPGDYLYERIVNLRYLAKRYVEWPPVNVELRARPRGDLVSYHVFVDNHEPELVRRLTVKGAVPAHAELVDSWAGSPGANPGKLESGVVHWFDADAQLSPDRDRREYVFVVRPRPGIPRADVKTTAWVEFVEPAPGVAMSEVVSADQTVQVTSDPAAGGRVSWTGAWPVSRNVPGYYGDAYQVHDAGQGAATFAWEVDLPEPGEYEVLAWWTMADDRATNAAYTVHAPAGPRTVRVNQREQGARWVSLGSYAFDAGPARVTLTDDADGVVIADAVRFRRR